MLSVRIPIQRPQDKHMVSVNWLLNDEPLSVKDALALELADDLLVGTSAATLRKALTDSGLGESVIGGGLSSELLQNTYSIGLKVRIGRAGGGGGGRLLAVARQKRRNHECHVASSRLSERRKERRKTGQKKIVVDARCLSLFGGVFFWDLDGGVFCAIQGQSKCTRESGTSST